jgi:hypothetical protein
MKEEFKKVLQHLNKMRNGCWKGGKAKYPPFISEALMQLEQDFNNLRKIIETFDDDFAKRQVGEKVDPKNSEIRASLVAKMNKAKLPISEEVTGGDEVTPDVNES